MQIILAHGALGWWDELIFLSVILIFLGMTGVSWVRGRQMPDELETDRQKHDDEPIEMLFEQDISSERFELK